MLAQNSNNRVNFDEDLTSKPQITTYRVPCPMCRKTSHTQIDLYIEAQEKTDKDQNRSSNNLEGSSERTNNMAAGKTVALVQQIVGLQEKLVHFLEEIQRLKLRASEAEYTLSTATNSFEVQMRKCETEWKETLRQKEITIQQSNGEMHVLRAEKRDLQDLLKAAKERLREADAFKACANVQRMMHLWPKDGPIPDFKCADEHDTAKMRGMWAAAQMQTKEAEGLRTKLEDERKWRQALQRDLLKLQNELKSHDMQELKPTPQPSMMPQPAFIFNTQTSLVNENIAAFQPTSLNNSMKLLGGGFLSSGLSKTSPKSTTSTLSVPNGLGGKSRLIKTSKGSFIEL